MDFVHRLRQDLQYALRLQARNPGFSAVVLLSLALGIGANTAIFQLLDAVRLRSLPVRDPQELAVVRIKGGSDGMGIRQGYGSDLTYPLWEGIRSQQQAFSGTFAAASYLLMAGKGAETQPVTTLWMSGDTFNVLGTTAQKGRLFAPADDRRGCAMDSAVISDSFWQRYFGGDDAAVGKTLNVQDHAVRVIGITPRTFTGLEVGKGFDIAFPLCALEAARPGEMARADFWILIVMGRLKRGWSLSRASAYLDAISPALFDAIPLTGYGDAVTSRYRGSRLMAESAANGISQLRDSYERPLWLLLGITGLVLLIASVNLANLMLARAAARQREIAVRIAIGASRARLMSQMFAESLLLAGAGGILSIAFAPLLSRGLLGLLATQEQTVLLNLSRDWRVLAFTAGIAVLTCIAFGLAPALRSSQISPGLAMKSGGRSLTSPRERFSLQRGLAVVQISVSLVLLFGALLFVQSLRNLSNVDAGFRQSGILFMTAGDPTGIRQRADAAVFQAGLLDEVRTIPHVESAALSSHVPLTNNAWSFFLHATNADGQEKADAWSRFTYVSPEYFQTMGTPILQGRDFNNLDSASSRKVAIVNKTFVRRYIFKPNPIGTLVRTVAEPGYPEQVYEIVGIVKDTKYTRLREDADAIAFVPSTQEPNPLSIAGITIRFSGSNSQVIADIKRRLGESRPGMILQFQPVEALLRDGLTMERLMAWLSGFFGVLAAILAVIGLYGVLSYMVQSRINEIGIRLALGSTRARVISLVVRETAFLLLAGLTVGAVGSLAASRATSALLFGLSPGDTNTLIASASGLALAAAAASYIPAWRASRVDPMVALRHE